jgi:hypothetical protein
MSGLSFVYVCVCTLSYCVCVLGMVNIILSYNAGLLNAHFRACCYHLGTSEIT